MDILKLNSISKLAAPILEGYNLTDKSDSPVGALVRSFVMHDWAVPSSLIAVARAGAGVNNIPCEDYAKKGIVVFNTPGANANAVKELVLSAMFISARNIDGGIAWANTLAGDDVAKQVEKGKGRFAGTEIYGKKLAVLGLGAIGRKVAVSANVLGMSVTGYDPYLDEAGKAEIPFVSVSCHIAEACKDADFISLHMPMTAETKGLVNDGFIKNLKPGVIIINAARGELADIDAVKAALAEGKIRKYVTDFPDQNAVNSPGIIAIPHLGASTEEAEDNCAIMAAEQLKEFIENGNIKNSVNFPALFVPGTSKHRVSIVSVEGTELHVKGAGVTKNGMTYTLADGNDKFDIAKLADVKGVVKARLVY